jgi:hypothetical protein
LRHDLHFVIGALHRIASEGSRALALGREAWLTPLLCKVGPTRAVVREPAREHSIQQN